MFRGEVMSDRLPTSFWVDALVRRADLGGASAFIVHKGDAQRGDVIIKVSRLDGTAALFAPSPLMAESRSFDWLPLPGAYAPEPDVDAIVSRRRGYDPDLWIIEVEDREGRHFLTEPVSTQ